ncbi:MAG TPA: M23 family metallopeptidase [Drouetiella sp.]
MKRVFREIIALSATAITSGASATYAFAATDVKVVNPIGEPPLSAQQAASAIVELRRKKLEIPITGFDISKVKGSFYETHGGVMHGAADMLAPRNTPVHAVENGKITKLFTSKRGGLTIYQADPSGRFVYYYAHLEKYAPGLHDGDSVKKGEIIGFVGTSGNAPPNTPHLHFSVGLGDALKKWWVTSSVDPYEVFK